MRLSGRAVLIIGAALFAGQAIAASDDIVMPPSPDRSKLRVYDEACANAGAVFVSNAEKVHPDEVPNWIRVCKAHPERSVCEDTLKIIAEVTGKSPFSCGDAR